MTEQAKILIVDDQLTNIQLIEMILDDYGYSHCSAQDGVSACELVSEDPTIQLVLMDVNMPGMDGMETTREIKKISDQRYLPVMFVTALDDSQTLVACLEAGGDDFIPKPVNEDILISKVRAHQRTTDMYDSLAEANKQLVYHRNILNHELHIVERVFNNGLSRFRNKFDHIDYHVSPMSMFNGDVLLVERSRLGSTYIVLGDFTGHGLASAIGCLPVSDVFQAMAIKHCSVGEIAREINRRLQSLLPDNMFFCAAIMELNQAADRLNVWMGGMHELVVLNDAGEYVCKIESQHMPLGVLEDSEFDDKEEVFSPSAGSHIIGFTDGVVESTNNQGEMFGTERLVQTLVDSYKTTEPVSHIEYVVQSLKAFQQKEGQDDDITLVSITCRPSHNQEAPLSPTALLATHIQQRVLPWSINLSINHELLGSTSVVHDVAQVVTGIDACKQKQEIVFLVLSELINNAIEHGILGLGSELKNSPEGFQHYYKLRAEKLATLDHGGLSLHCSITSDLPQCLKIVVTDTGAGFDYEQLAIEDVDETEVHGRGLPFIAALCESLEYSDGGRTATAKIAL